MATPSLALRLLDALSSITWPAWLAIASTLVLLLATFIYGAIYAVAPIPREARPSERTYKTSEANGKVVPALELPCWCDKFATRKVPGARSEPSKDLKSLEPAEIYLSVVVPAYNEQQRLGKMLEEACDFLEREYGTSSATVDTGKRRNAKMAANGAQHTTLRGWEVLIVSDGSTDGTEDVAMSYSKRFPGGRIRIVTLERNRGKGGAVTHGLRHVRGQHAVFADADGASHFPDVQGLVKACEEKCDAYGRCVAVGSRAHMVATDAVVKRSALRNFLMHGFHLLLWLMTPRATSQIRDTQCGFKMFSRASLPYIVPNMHSEGWIFDVEMLMLAESAGVPMVEVPITWREVQGSKLNVVWDSLGMAWGLAILRTAWGLGVYRTR